MATPNTYRIQGKDKNGREPRRVPKVLKEAVDNKHKHDELKTRKFLGRRKKNTTGAFGS